MNDPELPPADRTGELRESLLRQNAILNNIPDIAWLKDSESRFIAVNGPFGKACGVAPADLVGKTDYDVWPRDLAEGYRADDAEVMRTRARKRVEERLVGPDGRETWIETIKTPIVDAQGEVIGTTGIARDITERKTAEEKVRESRERYRGFFENAAVAVAIVDRDGYVVEANDTDCRFLGYPRSELIGMHFTQFTHPQDIDVDAELYQSLIGGQRQGYEIEKRYVRRDGKVVWGHLAVSLIRDSRGLPQYTLVVCVDITDRKLTAEALWESGEQYRAIFDGVGDAVFIHRMDADAPTGRFVAVNDVACRHLGYTREELLSLSLPQVDPLDETVIPSILEALRAGREALFETVHITKDRRRVPVEVRAKIIPYLGAPAVLSVARDITARKTAEEDLRKRSEGLAALLEVSKSLTETLDLRTVLQATTDGVTRLSGLNTAAVYLLEGDTLRLGATTPPLPPQFPEELRNAPLADHPHIRRAISSGQPVFVPDITASVLTPAERAVVEQRGLRTALYLPLLAGEKAVGTLIVNSVGTTREWPETISDLCRTLANLAALAVENAQLYKSGQQYAADLEQKIAERMRAEEALRESEEKFRSVFDSASDGILIVDPRTKQFVLGNATIARMLRVGRDDIPNLKVKDIHPAEALKNVYEAFEKVARGEAPFTENIPVLRRDGGVFFADIATSWIKLKGVTYMAGFFRDITERKKAEKALQESHQTSDDIVQTIPSGLYIYQHVPPDRLELISANPEAERLTGIRAGEWIGREFNEIWPAARQTGVTEKYLEVLRTGKTFETEDLQYQDDRLSGAFRIRAFALPGKRLAVAFENITTLKKAEQERLELERRLLHAQKLESLGVLAGGIAHDFNNLLMAILGNLDLALRNLSPVSPARANIEQSAQAARRATDLTRQMLAYSGKGRFIVKTMDLSELVEENAHLLRASIARTASLDLHFDRSLPPIEADAGQIQQVIMNLITNASEAIGEAAGRIAITTGVRDCDEQCLKHSRIEEVPPSGRFVMLEVSDTGCGMDEQTQVRLFDPFFSTKATGRGLGMSAMMGIVRGHRGAVFVESAVGAGTTVRILFPAIEGAQSAKEAAAGTHAAKPGASPLSGTVLVVDDEEIVREVCRKMIEHFGMQVLTASDGREAVEVFRRNAGRISHVILDLTMPNMDGMTAFKELVRIRPGVKVILCSGYNEQDSVQRLSGQGLAGFIQKPFSLVKLRDALEKAGTAS